MERVAIAVCAIDGLESMETGVGVVVNSFIEHFGEAVREIEQAAGITVALHCIFPKLLPGAKGGRKDLLTLTTQKCAETGGAVAFLPTLSDAREWTSLWFGTSMDTVVLQWSLLSREAAKQLDHLAQKYDRVVAISHDTPFASIMEHLTAADHVRCIWVPHSLGSIYDTDLERLAYEKRALRLHTSAGGHVGYVSEFFRTVLCQQYDVSPLDLIPFVHVLDLNSARYQPKELENSSFADRIPKDKPLIFSWGRCKPQKGFDLILEAAASFLLDPDFNQHHLAILMPDATTEPEYLKTIKNLIELLPKDRITIGWEFDPDAPYEILSRSNLSCVILASRFEAFGIVAREAKAFCAGSVRIIFSPIEPFATVFHETENAVVLGNLSAPAIIEAMRADRPFTTARAREQASYFEHQRTTINSLLRPNTAGNSAN